MLFAEIFGFGVDNITQDAWESRNRKYCPFRDSPCTKSSKENPLGICSISDGQEAASLCPVRFVERDQLFKDAARLSFGKNVEFGIFPEVRILRINAEDNKQKKIGKVDYLLGKIENGKVTDFAAVEVQAVYFSGSEAQTPFKYYMENHRLDISASDRRPDFRSSAQKRLMPQLQIKVPVFRRWGKRFFVAVDTHFFKSLPIFQQTTSANSEVTWLIYPIAKTGDNYKLGDVEIAYSEWDEVRNALREGTPPEPIEILTELQGKLDNKNKLLRILKS